MTSPYLQQPVRSLAQALKECGRARAQSALIVTLPRSRNLEPERYDAEDEARAPSTYPTGCLGASA